MGGKFSIKSIFSKGSKNDQIQIMEKEIPEMQKEIEMLGELCEIVNCIQGSVEIPKFKSTKQKQYYQSLASTSEQELDFLAAYGEFMKSVMVGLSKSAKAWMIFGNHRYPMIKIHRKWILFIRIIRQLLMTK